MKVRACMKCREYIMIKEGYKAQVAVDNFNKSHAGHVLGTVDYTEVKDTYKSKTNEFME